MAFYKANVSQDTMKEVGQGGEYISKSGIYDVKVNFVSVQTNEHGARTLDFNVDYKGNSTVIYQAIRLDNNDGSTNFQANLLDKLCVIADIEEVNDPVIQTHVVGKDSKPTDFSVLEDFTGLNLKLHIQFQYKKYNGKIIESKVIKTIFREDGATANEIISNKDLGKFLEKITPKAGDTKYDDGLTAEDIEEWKKSRSNDLTVAVTPKVTNRFATRTL